MAVSIAGGPLMLDLIGCAVVSTATRHHAHSVIRYPELALQRTLPVQPTNTRRCYRHAMLTHAHRNAWHPAQWD